MRRKPVLTCLFALLVGVAAFMARSTARAQEPQNAHARFSAVPEWTGTFTWRDHWEHDVPGIAWSKERLDASAQGTVHLHRRNESSDAERVIWDGTVDGTMTYDFEGRHQDGPPSSAEGSRIERGSGKLESTDASGVGASLDMDLSRGTWNFGLANVFVPTRQVTTSTCCADTGRVTKTETEDLAQGPALAGDDKPLPGSGLTLSGRGRITRDNGYTEYSYTLTPVGTDEDVKVSIEGCTDVLVGGVSQVDALGVPRGGKYTWSIDPPGAFTVQGTASSATATLSAKGPGRATLKVEYTAPNGKKAQGSRPASSVKLISVNGGGPIPRLGLYDAKGQPHSAAQTVPLQVEPGGGGDLLCFPPANPALLTAVPQGASLLLQGVREGRTTIQPETRCGVKTGPAFTVDVVPCDNEVIAQLTAEQKSLRGRLDSNRQQQTGITGDEEFDRAAREGAADIEKLAVKTGDVIASTLTASKVSGAKATESVKEVMDAASYVKLANDAINGRYDKVAFSTVLKGIGNAAKNPGASALLKGLGDASKLAGLAKKFYDAADAAQKVGRDLGTMAGAADRLAELEEQARITQADYDRVYQLLNNLCKSSSPPPEEKAKPAAPGEPKPAAGTKKAAGGVPQQEPPAAKKPAGAEKPEPKTGGPVTTDPPPPPAAASRPAIPMCTCSTAAGNQSVSVSGAKGVAVVLKGHSGCVSDFENAARSFAKEFETFDAAVTRLGAMAGSSGDEFERARAEEAPKIEAFAGKVEAFGHIAEKSQAATDGCLRSTFESSIQTIRVRY